MKPWLLTLTIASTACTYSPNELVMPDCLEQGQDGCDGVDNDCDDEIDEDCCNSPGESRACGSDRGECTAGEQTCTDGVWTGCVGEVVPRAETCADQRDHDCDGLPGCLDLDCYEHTSCVMSCTANAGALSCADGSFSIDTSSATNTMSWYSCAPWDETGGEHVYSFSVTDISDVNISALPASGGTNVDIFVLGGGCDATGCLTYGDLFTSFVAFPDETYFIVFDSYDNRDGPVDVDIWCVPIWEMCANGADDNGDGLVDCDDPTCTEEAQCAGSTCIAPAEMFCNQPILGSHFGTSDVIEDYACGLTGLAGPEQGWSFTPTQGGTVEIDIEVLEADDVVEVLFLGDPCAGGECLLAGAGTVDVTQGSTYHVVVDGGDGERHFRLRAVCDWEDCSNNLDDDDDGLIDSADWQDCLDDSSEHCLNGHDDDGEDGEDCADPSCATDSACLPNECHRGSAATCGANLSGSTATRSFATDILDSYAGACGDIPMGLPEHAFLFEATGNGDVTVDVTAHDGGEASLFVLEDDCVSTACIATAKDAITWTAEADVNYYVVVDSDDRIFSFDMAVGCGFEQCGWPGDEDDDGLEGCDDLECVGTRWCPSGVCASEQIVDQGSSCPWAAALSPGVPNNLGDYPVCGAYSEFGGEHIFRMHFDTDTAVHVTATGDPLPTSLFVLDGECAAQACVGTGINDLTLSARGGRDYFLVVDGIGGATSLAVSCDAPLPEDGRCANGIDDDGDGAIDCEDSECEWACEANVCSTNQGSPLGCGANIVDATSIEGYISGGATTANDNIDDYSCSSWGAAGPEKAYELLVDRSGPVTVHLASLAHLKWYILEGACDPNGCIFAGSETGTFDAIGGRLYYLVVDGVENDAAGPFELSIACE